METRTYEIEREGAPKFRAVLDQYVRITYTEKKGSWLTLTPQLTFFRVTGPVEWLDKLEPELKAIDLDVWSSHQL